MTQSTRIAAVAAALAVCTIESSDASPPSSADLEVTVTQNTPHLMPYQVFELTFQHAAAASAIEKSSRPEPTRSTK